MSYIFCSKGFRQFFDAMQKNISSIDSMVGQMKMAFPYVAAEVKLGRFEMQIESPASIYEPQGMCSDMVVYQAENGYEDMPKTERFRTEECGHVTTIAYPVKGHIWSKEEQDAVIFLAQNIFVLGERTRMKGLMKKAITIDSLTGAANSNGLSQFGKKLEKSSTFHLYNGAIVNIKNFRYINQKVGAGQGDHILKEYCRKIMDYMLPDELIAHLSGDNFILLVKKERTEDLLKLMEDIEVPCYTEEGERLIKVETRMGWYFINYGDKVTEAMNGATAALNYARQSTNSDYMWYEPSMMEAEIRDKGILVDFPRAIKDQEFIVYYQPKVSLEDNSLCGSEALVRWIRNGKLVPPMEFIPALEREGSVRTLDFYVFESVCRDIQSWIRKGIAPVKVSVNFSKLHLQDEHFADKIVSLLNQYEVDSSFLEVELTETASYEDYEKLTGFITSMKDSGVAVSIDDFGTGYSSLSLLKDLKVDIIKLDKSFLDSLEKQREQDEIVIKNIVKMVNELHMDIIAEGVETRAQADFLRDIHCSMAQGYLFDRPMPCEEFEKRLQERKNY